MAALTTQQEYDLVREAIQRLTTLDAEGNPRNMVSFSIEGFSGSYSASQLPDLRQREIDLANRLAIGNARKRVTPDFSFD